MQSYGFTAGARWNDDPIRQASHRLEVENRTEFLELTGDLDQPPSHVVPGF
jgi:hypothetical protein